MKQYYPNKHHRPMHTCYMCNRKFRVYFCSIHFELEDGDICYRCHGVKSL